MMCKELVYMLADYFNETIDPRLREELDDHLARCKACLAFTKTFQATCDGTRKLREAIEYSIPPDVCERLETFVRTAALKYPEKVKEYRDQVERDRREKVSEFVRRTVAGTLPSSAALLSESHCAACPECRAFFGSLRETGGLPSWVLPENVRSHLIRLMQTLPPGEEFFLA